MKIKWISVLMLTACFGLSACNFPSIFGGDEQPQRQPDGDDIPKVIVEITGGFAGVQRELTIDPDGITRFVDSIRSGRKWVVMLDSKRLEQLNALFLENNFFELGETYLNPELADAFIYDISFRDQGKTKTVIADGYEDPEGLMRIIEGVRQLIDEISSNGLQLELQVSATEIQAGASVEATLLVSNAGSSALQLDFSSGQTFDFYAGQNNTDELGPGSRSLVWNWAHDKAFTQVLRQESLAPGETRSYQITWDGRSNEGQQVVGVVRFGAELLSIPGGSPAAVSMTIQDAE